MFVILYGLTDFEVAWFINEWYINDHINLFKYEESDSIWSEQIGIYLIVAVLMNNWGNGNMNIEQPTINNLHDLEQPVWS